MENETIIEFFLTKEFIENYVEEYSKRKKMRVEVEQKQSLYMNRNDFQYIVSYAIENGLEETEIVRMTHLGLNYYSAIIILEYAKKFNKDIDQIITFTLNIDKEENASLLWLIKLGYKDYISNLMEKNKYLIHYIIQDKKQILCKNYVSIDEEDIYSFLSEQLLRRFVLLTVPIEYFFASFKAFISSCIEKYLLRVIQQSMNRQSNSIDDFNRSYIVFASEENVENSFIETENTNLIMDALDTLNDREREFINLRYGFGGYSNNLTQIKAIWDSKGIFVSMEELEQMESNILEKLRQNPKILEIRQIS